MNRIYIETTNPENDKKTNEYRFFEYLLRLLGLEAELIGIGGKEKLRAFENQFKDTTKSGDKNLVIIDADGEWNIDNWDFESESEKISSLKQELGVEFELFFLPNHELQGDFETLLEAIVAVGHKRVLDCHIQFENCIEGYEEYITPNRKARLYSYITSFRRSHKQNENFKNKGDWFFDNEELWDFNVDGLEPLKSFILSHF
ncbi:hypothetical protein [Runella sp.]|uniref:hypothetical protein n=1 Tax=Runella sp. TaxID=1960881 RepID=UPI003D0E2E7B